MSNENGREYTCMKPIAHIETDFDSKFGIPRQSGITWELVGRIVFEEDYRIEEALRGIENYSHLWLLWEFSENLRSDWTPTVRPPKLGGNVRMGVFATRSPFRPNPIGLSCVKLIEVCPVKDKGLTLLVSGADMVNGTPIYDIKPYLPYTDCHTEATGGFTDELEIKLLDVHIPDEYKGIVPEGKLEALECVLAQDPRPAYHDDPERIYGFSFAGMEVKFKVCGESLYVTGISQAFE